MSSSLLRRLTQELGPGKNGQVLTYSGGTLTWRTPVVPPPSVVVSPQGSPGRQPYDGQGERHYGGAPQDQSTDINAGTHGTLEQQKGGTGFEGYATGDLLVGSGSMLHRLSAGAAGQVLVVSGATLQWADTVTGNLTGSGGDARYVNVSGDTMSGTLTIAASGLSLVARGTVSGATLHASSFLQSSGSLAVERTAFFKSSVGIGTGTPETALEIIGTASGSRLFATTALSTSGTLVVQGAATFRSTGVFAGNLTTRGTLSGAALAVMGGNSYLLGNVGIGTTSPGGAAHIVTNGSYGLIIDAPSASNHLAFRTAGSEKWIQYLNGNDLRFYDTTDRLTLKSGGNVGIGTASPALKLDVLDGTSTNKVLVLRRGSQGSDASMVTSFGTPYLVIGGTEFKANSLQTIGFGFSNGATTNQPAEIGFLTTSTAGSTQGDIVFANRNGTTNVAPTEVLRITSAGNVGIGTTSPKAKLDVVGTISGSLLNISNPSGTNYIMGKVGIGTATPTAGYAIDINGNVKVMSAGTNYGFLGKSGTWGDSTTATDFAIGSYTTALRLYGGSSSTPGLTVLATYAQTPSLVTNTSGTNYGFFGKTGTWEGNADANAGIASYTSALKFYTNNNATARMTLDSAGNLGIGKTSPAAKLDVVGTMSGSALTVMNGTSYLMGNVGIGTSSPITQLHVAGKLPTTWVGSGATATNPYAIAVRGRQAYVVNQGSSTLRIYDVSNVSSPLLLSSIATGSAPDSVDVQGRYAYVGTSVGTVGIYDVANPAGPVLMSTLTLGGGSNVPTVVVQGRYLYAVDYATGMLVIADISNPSAPVKRGSVSVGSFPNGLAVQGGYAYVDNSSRAFYIIDVRNPANPVTVNTVASNFSGGDSQISIQGRYAYVGSNNNCRLDIIDVSNPASPSAVSSAATSGCATPFPVAQGRYVYTANGGTSQLQVFDVGTPASPVSLGTIPTGTTPRALAVQGRYAYVVNGGNNSLTIFDLGGAYIQQLEAGGIEAGTLSLRNGLSVLDGDFRGGVTIARSLNVSGPSAFVNTATGASAYALSVISNTGALRLSVRGNGASALAPNIQFGSGTVFDTALFRSAANTLRTSGTFVASTLSGSALTVMNGTSYLLGNVGLGTTSPSERLTLSGAMLINSNETNASNNAIKVITNAGSTNNTVFRVTAGGDAFADGAFTGGGADYAEWFYASSPDLQPGEAVCVDVSKQNTVARCARSGDPEVMGIISTKPAFVGNKFTGADGLPVPRTVLVGLIGQVPGRAVVESGASIHAGDSLTPSAVPGSVRKAKPGESTVGVALEDLLTGKGVIQVLIARRNESLTVAAIDDRVTASIKDMKIEDEITASLHRTLDGLTASGAFAQPIQDEVRKQLSSLSLEEMVNQLLDRRLGDGSLAVRSAAATTGSSLRLSGSLTASGAVHAGGTLTADALVSEKTLLVAGDTSIGGDLYLGGMLRVKDLFVPGLLKVDGALEVGSVSAQSGSIKHLAVDHLTAGSGSRVTGTLLVEGRLLVASGGTLAFGNGSSVEIGTITARDALHVLGDITVRGLATFLGDVQIDGQLTLSSRQAGFAEIAQGSTGVTVRFDPPLSALPIVTATPHGKTGGEWWTASATETGFTILVDHPLAHAVGFSWTAFVTDGALTPLVSSSSSGSALLPFPVDAHGVPLTGNDIEDTCLRNQTPLDGDGHPYNCSRYHVDHVWQFGVLTFEWNTLVDPPRLTPPAGYVVVTTAAGQSASNAPVTGTGATGTGGTAAGTGDTLSASAPSSLLQTVTATGSTLPSSSAPASSSVPAVSAASSASSVSAVDGGSSLPAAASSSPPVEGAADDSSVATQLAAPASTDAPFAPQP